MNKHLIDIYLFLMFILAKIQIMYNNYIGRHLKIINNCFNTKFEEKIEYIYVKDGEEIVRNNNSNFVIEDKYDFVIKKEKCEKDNKFYGQLSDNICDVLGVKKRIDSKFMSVTLIHDNTEYAINIDEPINFNMEGNVVLDYAFIKWYMNVSHGITINKSDTYELKVMDNNINIHSLTELSYIELKKEKYEITHNSSDTDNSE